MGAARQRAKRGDPKLAIAYLRVSTTAERQSLGLEAQRAAIERWARETGTNVVGVYVEEVSGGVSIDQRPVLLEAIGAVLAHGAGLLVVQKLDRFSRDPVAAALAESELRRSGASLAVVEGGGGSDPTSELIRSILLAVGRFERMMIKARVKAALDVKRRRGELTGVAPYGMRRAPDGKTLEPDPEEGAIKDRLRELRRSGLTVRGVLAHATTEGLRNRVGKPFTLRALHALIRDVAA